MSAPVLSARDLHRELGAGAGRVEVLRGVDLDLHRGIAHAVVGPSGCGKSTLLYLLGLIDRPDAGSIVLDGVQLAAAAEEARTRARREKIGFIFQFHFLLKEFTVLENILLPMRRLGAELPAAQLAHARELLAAVGMADKSERTINQLSGGEQQRVAVARALANRPALLLADEPTGNLDQNNSNQVFELLLRFARDGGMAMLMVTHNPELAARCDVQLSMRDGRFTDGL
jgi:lipoprotein-releasing system ATP-binding protein